MADLWRLSISEASESLARREISAVELTRAHLDRIEEVEGRVRAFVTVTDQDALRETALTSAANASSTRARVGLPARE